MLSKLILASGIEAQKEAVLKELTKLEVSLNHPDLLWIEDEGKIGVEEIKKIRGHFSFKPYSAKGKTAVIISSENLTQDAQNALLKTLEEPPEGASLILAASGETALLPTILSRCQIVQISNDKSQLSNPKDVEIGQLVNSSIGERFKIVEQTEEKEKLLEALTVYIHRELPNHPEKVKFAKLLLEASEWQKSNVSIRTILEYLMLEL